MIAVRLDPFREIVGLQDRMNRLFSDVQTRWGGEESTGTWSPAVDIHEIGDTLVFRMEIPGVKSEDIDVSVEKGVLMMKGERKRDERFGDENAYRIERQYGAFARSFSLPTTIDPERIKATYRDGILEVELQKLEAAKPRKIEIQAA